MHVTENKEGERGRVDEKTFLSGGAGHIYLVNCPPPPLDGGEFCYQLCACCQEVLLSLSLSCLCVCTSLSFSLPLPLPVMDY